MQAPRICPDYIDSRVYSGIILFCASFWKNPPSYSVVIDEPPTNFPPEREIGGICRINAENPAFNFAPSPGTIQYLLMPSGGNGLRVDSAMFAGADIPPYYDAMIAKIITKGANRAEAIAKMQRALGEMVIDGIISNQFFQEDLLMDKRFVNGEYDTSFLQDVFLKEWKPRIE